MMDPKCSDYTGLSPGRTGRGRRRIFEGVTVGHPDRRTVNRAMEYCTKRFKNTKNTRPPECETGQTLDR